MVKFFHILKKDQKNIKINNNDGLNKMKNILLNKKTKISKVKKKGNIKKFKNINISLSFPEKKKIKIIEKQNLKILEEEKLLEIQRYIMEDKVRRYNKLMNKRKKKSNENNLKFLYNHKKNNLENKEEISDEEFKFKKAELYKKINSYKDKSDLIEEYCEND